jgi:hypothetical protein
MSGRRTARVMNRCVCFRGALFAALAALFAATDARADSSVIRGPDLGTSVTLFEGYPVSSRAAWIRPWLALTYQQRMPFDAFGAGVGVRRTIAGGPRGWALSVQLGGGLSFATLYPGAVLEFSPSTNLRVRGDWAYFSMGLAVPAALRLDATGDVRIPVQGELWLAFRTGPVWIGAMAAMGVTFVPNASSALSLQGGAYIAIPYGEGRASR